MLQKIDVAARSVSGSAKRVAAAVGRGLTTVERRVLIVFAVFVAAMAAPIAHATTTSTPTSAGLEMVASDTAASSVIPVAQPTATASPAAIGRPTNAPGSAIDLPLVPRHLPIDFVPAMIDANEKRSAPSDAPQRPSVNAGAQRQARIAEQRELFDSSGVEKTGDDLAGLDEVNVPADGAAASPTPSAIPQP